MIIAVLMLTTLISSGLAVYYHGQAQQVRQGDGVVVQDEVKQLVVRVGRLMDLPQDEEPSVATVSDIERLKDKPFFAQAQQGDRVLLYAKAKKAILYNPREDKIVEVAPLTDSGEAAPKSASDQAPVTD